MIGPRRSINFCVITKKVLSLVLATKGLIFHSVVTSLSHTGHVRVFSVLPSLENKWLVGEPTRKAVLASLRKRAGSISVATLCRSVAAIKIASPCGSDLLMEAQ